MRIGIDLDGVVFDTEKEFRVYSELYDAKDLNQNSKVDNREFRFQDRFNWTEEELKGFLEKYHKQIILEANYLPGAKRVLNFLKQNGFRDAKKSRIGNLEGFTAAGSNSKIAVAFFEGSDYAYVIDYKDDMLFEYLKESFSFYHVDISIK